MAATPTLFSPIRIGGLELRNRLVMSPMETQYATRDALPSERSIAFYEARARGGVGLITLGACMVDPEHREVPRSLDFGRDEVVGAHRGLTDRVHAHGAKIQPQLAHPGPDGLAPYLSSTPNLGPSVIQSYLTGIACRELPLEEIPAIVAQYGAAAERIRAAGYDGIELHAAHGYMLLGSFLSPLRNRRTDAYAGNTEEGRIRLIVEVTRAIKEAAGADFPVTLRISGTERAPGGRGIDDTQRIAPKLVAAGIDAFHVSGGVIDRLTTQMVTGSHYGPAHNLAAAAAVKQAVDVPVMTVGRIHDPALAERVLADGKADLVAMGRPLLADAELANKAREGRIAELRRCISCQSCIDSMEQGRMSCAVNAFTGREAELERTPARVAKRVVVVGAGPAGLEAARIASGRGHRVVIFERERHLGGALVMAAAVHRDNEPLLDFLRVEIHRSAVTLRLGEEATVDSVVASAPDAVVVASGGRVEAPDLPGAELPHVWTGTALRHALAGRMDVRRPAWQRAGLAMAAPLVGRRLAPAWIRSATRLWMPFGRRVAIVGADLAALELAEFLCARGRDVVVLEPGDGIAPEVGQKRRSEHMDQLDRLGVPVRTGVSVSYIDESAVVLEDGRRVPADGVILAGVVKPATELFDALEGRVPERHAIGDCTGLGLIRKAIEEGARVGCVL